MKKQIRPAEITTILQTIGSDYSEEAKAALEAYISRLENREEIALPDQDQSGSLHRDNPPVWSQQRHNERDQHRLERDQKKRNNYQ